jgi:phytoene desaturase
MKRIVVIGGGVSGLAAGCLLTRRGMDVTLFEANEKPGGCCATTRVDGFTFHDGAGYVAVPRLLDRAFAVLGLDRRELVPLRRVVPMLEVRLPDGTFVTWRDGFDVEIEGAAFDRKRLQAELQHLSNRWLPVLDTAIDDLMAAPFSSWRALRYTWKHLHKMRGTAGAELRRLISDQRVRAALAGALLHTGLPADCLPVSSVLALAAMATDGWFLPARGMGSIPDALAAAFWDQGGRVHLGSRVTRIIVERGGVCGVQVDGQDRIDASGVISTVSPMSTFTSLVDPEFVAPAIARRIRRARLSHRAMSLQLGLANHVDAPALVNMVLPMMDGQHEVVAQEPRNVRWPVYSIPTMALPELAPSGGSVIEMFVPIASELAQRQWTAAEKQEITESALQALRCRHALDVVVARLRTPADFRDRMHLYEGALYGLSPAAPPRDHFSHVSPVPGLVLAGQCTYPGYGVGPAIVSGIFAAETLATSEGATRVGTGT